MNLISNILEVMLEVKDSLTGELSWFDITYQTCQDLLAFFFLYCQIKKHSNLFNLLCYNTAWKMIDEISSNGIFHTYFAKKLLQINRTFSGWNSKLKYHTVYMQIYFFTFIFPEILCKYSLKNSLFWLEISMKNVSSCISFWVI